MKDKTILHALSFVGIIGVLFGLNRKPRKDWIIVFLLKTLISSFLGNIVAARKMLEFPIRLFPKAYKSSVLYDNLLFPLMCVFYNQTTYKSKIIGIIAQSLLYSAPMTLLEVFFERRTNLIKYHSWKWYYTLLSLAGTFMITRGAMGWIRFISKNEEIEDIKKEGS